MTTYAPDEAHARRVDCQFLALAARAMTAAQRAQIAATANYGNGFRGERLDPRRPIVASGTDLADQLANTLKMHAGISELRPDNLAEEDEPLPAFASVRAQVVAGYAGTPSLLALDETQRREWGVWLMVNQSYMIFTLLGSLFEPSGPGLPRAVAEMQTRTRSVLRDPGLDHARVRITAQGLRLA